MILNPKFYAPLPLDRAAERIRLGLRPDLPTALASFGGQGSMDAVKVARAIRSESEVLRAAPARSRRRAHPPRTPPGLAHRAGVVRRARFDGCRESRAGHQSWPVRSPTDRSLRAPPGSFPEAARDAPSRAGAR